MAGKSPTSSPLSDIEKQGAVTQSITLFTSRGGMPKALRTTLKKFHSIESKAFIRSTFKAQWDGPFLVW